MPPRSRSPHEGPPALILPEPIEVPEPLPEPVPLLPLALPDRDPLPLDFEDESDDEEEDYPEDAIEKPFPEPCSFQITMAEALISQSYYLTINKEDTRETALLWVSTKGDDSVTFAYGETEVNVSYAQANAMLNTKYVFRVSKDTPSSTPPRLSSSSDFEIDQSYVIIPEEHPERIKLMKYLGKEHENFKWQWRRSAHGPQPQLSMTPALMEEVIDHSNIYRVSWPFAVEF